MLAQSIRNNSATANALRAVTDGSFKDNFGTAAWILECANTSQQMSGNVVAPGSAHDHSSYCSELSGVYAVLLVTNRLCLYFNIPEGSFLLGCDSQSTLATAFFATSFCHSIKTPCFDLLGAIRQLRISSPMPVHILDIMLFTSNLGQSGTEERKLQQTFTLLFTD
jgi:hypothetical protein